MFLITLDWEMICTLKLLYLVDLLESRQSTGLQMVTSQVDPKGWKGLFEDPVIADAVIDRIINPPHHIILKGGSYLREVLSVRRREQDF